MTDEQAKFLRERLEEASQADPNIPELRGVLLRLGGIEIVPPRTVDPDVAALIVRGSLMSNTVQLEPMERSACHENIAKLWEREPRYLQYIGTGYALTQDGLWRQHSWGVKHDGTIIETTALRTQYFGLLLQGDEADFFASCNSEDQG